MDSQGEQRTLLSRIGHNFLTGLFLLLPIGITFAVLFFLMDLIGRYVQPLTQMAATWGFHSIQQPLPDFAECASAGNSSSLHFGQELNFFPHKQKG